MFYIKLCLQFVFVCSSCGHQNPHPYTFANIDNTYMELALNFVMSHDLLNEDINI